MTKATDTLLVLFAASAIYFVLYSGVIPTSAKFHDDILPYIPWWSLVTFGSYALATLGWDVFTFKDKVDKYEELVVQIDQAKEFYRKEGINID